MLTELDKTKHYYMYNDLTPVSHKIDFYIDL